MGRVSLTEDYDDRSVIAKLNEMDKRVTENTTVVTSAEASAKQSAQAAQETADRFAGSVGAVVQNANAQINASKAQVDQAKAEVDETVTTVAQAVQTANDASASAQQSANTVAGYDARLTATESKNDQQDTAISALQTADGQNVKINRINDYAVGLTGNQTVQAVKNFAGELIVSGLWNNKAVANVENTSTWRRIYYNVTTAANQMLALFMTPQKPGQFTNEYGILIVGNGYAKWVVKGNGVIVENFVVVVNADNQLELWVKNYNGNRGLAFTRLNETNWGSVTSNWRADNSTVDAAFDPTTYQSYTVSS